MRTIPKNKNMALGQIFKKNQSSSENLSNYRQAVSTLLDIISPPV